MYHVATKELSHVIDLECDYDCTNPLHSLRTRPQRLNHTVIANYSATKDLTPIFISCLPYSPACSFKHQFDMKKKR